MCGQPDLARTAAQIKPKSGANGVIDFSGHFAWFDPFSDGFASVVPPNEDPTAAQWATIYSYLATKLSSDASHRSSFTLKLGYRGKSVYLRGPSEKPKTMADSVLASHGAEIVGGFVGDVEFTEDDIPRYYSFNIDLSCVHGYEARLAVPPRMGLRGQGLFKMRRIWADPRDPNKELFEGVWDLTVSADSRHTKGRYGMDEDGEGSGALFWAIRHEAGKGEENDNEDESCFY
ncbi:uncharacterized protein PHACADRAFT_248792 [Phanerochaete carnosa HHB-10118-sp]|uniref:Uncharacterized protein n=1 Tax=Phanerochaete carnosa (strain HHB-10118-sp) TaxID=650164 RepID=K5WD70_PHACS|nr:uncharacterized protein PHACADRAFT_248792 [Phanerochaete carnosa HHB-10118-sp]EKM61888.1 hypothetical protein PHACADRAFT_248792 [Phanerochaete carnosa HHB-10118-sp]